MATSFARRFCSFAGALCALAALAIGAAGGACAQDPVWRVPDIGALPDDAHGRLVRQGREIITQTAALIGPGAPDPSQRFAGNNLACADCHLLAGTKKFGLPLFGLIADFPAYSARRGAEISLPQRIDSCLTRSLNGRAAPAGSPAIVALVAYLDFLSSGMTPGEQLTGHGSGAMPELDRAADPKRGEPIYAAICASCHRADGAGLPRDPGALRLGYAVPPLWGADSFNDGAGMARLITMANFAHSNMPAGADYLNPKLSAEDAWDVAAFVESQPRPQKPGLDHDFPDLIEKPIDAPYGPYADGFGAEQHKYGPFAPMRAKIARLKAEPGEKAR
ncbi:c-type cytochrome [Methylocella silvestris]|uniref:Cystathionine gamma-synthase n=1 Tax=Methylocella silvestris TaxID=199596 RepID=A0A2J7TDX9_METSI|nr:c-type cytochrome [Methylocella silvestris]PNG24972.1 cystathionine gamma-synthase [Methylocella silvestris]